MTTDFDVTNAMVEHGGSFVAGLGLLWRRADPLNKARLKAAFPEYWQTYQQLAERKQHDAQ